MTDNERIKVLYKAHQQRENFKHNLFVWAVAGAILIVGLIAMSQN